MKKWLLAALALSLSAFIPVRATEYVFDKAHSHIGFSVSHILGKVPGEFKDYDGGFSFDPKSPEKSKVKVSIQVNSIDTGIEKRDEHLKSPAFFDVAPNPKITFVSKKVASAGDQKYSVVGDLTIHGVSKSVTLDVDYLGKDEMMGTPIAAFSATTKIDRRDFGLVYGKDAVTAGGNLMVGNDVTIQLDITGMDKVAAEKAQKMMKSAPQPKPTEAAK
jgi:polyisoprenoid-binding protein YceI